jgi:hypothetical protein
VKPPLSYVVFIRSSFKSAVHGLLFTAVLHSQTVRPGVSNVPSSELRMAAFGMVLAVAYSISDNTMSNLPSVVRIGADNRHVAG